MHQCRHSLQPSNFNPRSHERSDRRGNQLCYRLYISIHAPTRGATGEAINFVTDSTFQSTLPREERPITGYSCPLIGLFQSTLPREERQCFFFDTAFFLKFQSTLPREERPSNSKTSVSSSVFQSTLPREERQ